MSSIFSAMAPEDRQTGGGTPVSADAETITGWSVHDQSLIADVLDLMTEGVVLYDAEGRFVFCNETYREFYTMIGDLLVPGTPFSEILHVSLERGQITPSEGDYLTRRLKLFDDATAEHEQQLSDGRWLRVAERRLASGYVLGTRTDITELKQREQAFEESEQRLADAVSALQEGFALFDADDRLVVTNDTYRSYFPLVRHLIEPGVKFEELIRRAADQGQNVESMDDPEKWVQDRLDAHARADSNFEHKFSDGRHVWVKETKTREGGTLSTYIDITALKLREQELEHAKKVAEMANRAKTEFLANMSHELRTPLNAVIGFTEVMCHQMLGPIENERYRFYLDNIFESSSHLLRMVEDLLDFGKMEANRVELNEEVVDVTEIIAEAISVMNHQAKQSGISLYSGVPQPGPLVYADRLALKKALINLIANGLKFTPEGGHVGVSCRADESGDV
ncbi:MAG: PAS-domain containing protein, partial [Alphaproteobacteria bacterium]